MFASVNFKNLSYPVVCQEVQVIIGIGVLSSDRMQTIQKLIKAFLKEATTHCSLSQVRILQNDCQAAHQRLPAELSAADRLTHNFAKDLIQGLLDMKMIENDLIIMTKILELRRPDIALLCARLLSSSIKSEAYLRIVQYYLRENNREKAEQVYQEMPQSDEKNDLKKYF